MQYTYRLGIVMTSLFCTILKGKLSIMNAMYYMLNAPPCGNQSWHCLQTTDISSPMVAPPKKEKNIKFSV